MFGARPVQEAQRISEYTPPGEVWVTEAVLAATERISIYKPVEFGRRHPLAGTVAFWALDGFRVQPRPARGVSGIHARLIGRDTPLQAMLSLSQNLERGIGGLVWIEGEPGIGKSRLMEEFVAEISSSGAMILAGRCSPQKSSLAFSLDLRRAGADLRRATAGHQRGCPREGGQGLCGVAARCTGDASVS